MEDDIVFLSEKPFLSIQGEGKTQGRNSLFIRFSGCNLRCAECDSKYTWKDKGDYKITFDDLCLLIKQYENIVFTGGEPLLLKNLEIIKKLIYQNPYKSFEIETNGTISLSKEDENFFKFYNVLFNISPKGNFYSNLNCEPILFNNNIDFIAKFLFKDVNDFDYIDDIIKKYKIAYHKIWVQPKGIKSEDIRKIIINNYYDILKRGYNISIRNHIFLFENKKEV